MSGRGGLALRNLDRGVWLCRDLRLADRPWSRLRGLLGRRELPPGRGLLLVPCASVHTFGMRFPIDVLFLDRDLHVIRAVPSLSPWRGPCTARGAWCTVELPVGTIASSGTRAGDRLQVG